MHRCALLVCALAACDPLAGSGYVGEPLFTLQGTVASTALGDDAAGGGLALMWQDSASAAGPGVAATTVPVTLEFPSRFRVPVPVPPPEAVRFAFDDGAVQIAEAYIYVVADPQAQRPVGLAVDRTHVLAWASADVPAGSLAADYLGEPIGAGYHLRRYAPVTAAGAAQSALIDRCVSNGEDVNACHARRAYQLGGASDDDTLRIVVSQQ